MPRRTGKSEAKYRNRSQVVKGPVCYARGTWSFPTATLGATEELRARARHRVSLLGQPLRGEFRGGDVRVRLENEYSREAVMILVRSNGLLN